MKSCLPLDRRAFLTGSLLLAPALVLNAAAPEVVDWTLDRLDQIGGHPTTILGHPKVVTTELGKAVQFNGEDDALFIDVHPLAGVRLFTWEVIFRPDPTGHPEQRFIHYQERDPATGADTNSRMLFEIRIIGDRWCLDSFATKGDVGKTLIDRTKLHPTGQWQHAALVYDGTTLRNFVNGELQGEGDVKLEPQGPGHSSFGVRINKRDYFKGEIQRVRMTRHALPTDEFLKVKAG